MNKTPVSAHILLDNDLDELGRADCPHLYEVLVQQNIANLMQAGKITIEEFNHYCKRLAGIVAQRPRSES